MAELPVSLRALIEGPNYAHLAAVLPDGLPHSVPLWAGLEGDRVAFLTGPGPVLGEKTFDQFTRTCRFTDRCCHGQANSVLFVRLLLTVTGVVGSGTSIAGPGEDTGQDCMARPRASGDEGTEGGPNLVTHRVFCHLRSAFSWPRPSRNTTV